MRAAVPKYVSRDGFNTCPPGHRFNLYFELWQDNWELHKDSKTKALSKVLSMQPASGLLKAVLQRQCRLVDCLPQKWVHVVEARSTAPFATGLGLEHPVENGFAFLSPYGLPYLAGSGIKGVLRHSAQELLNDKEEGFNEISIGSLFGLEDTNNGRRGALSFWDVFPQCEEMVVDIMTPHYSHYYQDGKTPHDAGKPNPIPFLVVPAEASFRFIVVCNPVLLGEKVQTLWKDLVDKIFAHTFDWLGFGAKTAVGYGAMQRISDAEIERIRQESEADALRCNWVDQTISELARQHNSGEENILRGKPLAEAWQAIEDSALKHHAMVDIRARWQAEGWWDSPPGKSARKAKNIYEGNE